jgi:hypothetical protein
MRLGGRAADIVSMIPRQDPADWSVAESLADATTCAQRRAQSLRRADPDRGRTAAFMSWSRCSPCTFGSAVLRRFAPAPSRAAVTDVDAAPCARSFGVGHMPQRRVGPGLTFGMNVVVEKVDEDALGLHFHGHGASVNLPKPEARTPEDGLISTGSRPL